MRRLVAGTPTFSQKLAVAVVLLLIVGGVRALADLLAPGVMPFSLLFPAILVATLVGGWISGALVLAIGGLFAWIVVLNHPIFRHGTPPTTADALNLALYAISGLLLVLLVVAYRASARELALRDAQRLEEGRRSLAALRESEERLRLASDAARLALWRSEPEGHLTHTSELTSILGLPPDQQLTADDVRGRYLPGELERIRKITAAAYARGERQIEIEARFRRADGAVRWILLRAEIGPNEAGEIRGRHGVAMDVTERREGEERMRLLAREVDHRANNLLTVLLGVVRMSTAATAAALKDVLLGRISALGRAHQLLSVARWEGASLRRIVEEELQAFRLDEDGRILVEGPDAELTPAAAQGVAMALHELATNALKYGALQAPEGRVSVRWSRPATDRLLIVWEEQGGPPVTPPARRGLGTTILERALGGPIGGATRLHWLPEGLRCEMELPDAAAGHAESRPAA